MIIVVGEWKKKILRIITILILILAFAVAVPVLAGSLYDRVPALSGWFQDEHPTGNPMRVEQDNSGTKFEQVVDQFVFKLQDFYYDE